MSDNAKREKQTGGLLIPGLAFAFAIYYFSDIWGERSETMAYGLLVGSLVIVLSILLVLSHRRDLGRLPIPWRKPDPSLYLGQGLRRIQESWRPIFLFGALFLHAVLQSWIGFTLSTALFLGIVLWVLGTRHMTVWISTTIGLTLAVHVIFLHLLNVPLPRGPFL